MITASGTTITDADKAAMHVAVEKGWITASGVNKEFERGFGEVVGVPYVRTTNSGSSANLLAVAAMVEAGVWRRGDEIITSACAFPTTVNPLLLYGLVPVFVDVELGTYNPTVDALKAAITTRTMGIMMAHTLGNPFDRRIFDLGFPVVEDCCDALGSKYENGRGVGTLGEMGTCSFFPAHHITMGEGGAVFSKNKWLMTLAESVRDWGRDCYCEPGCVDTCGKRFEQPKRGQLPYGYDHKYTYTRLGFNLKITEIQAALGLSQLGRVAEFIAARRRNFDLLTQGLQGLDDHLVLPVATPGTDPSWFGFPITIRAGNERQALQEWLYAGGVDTRLIFSGNLTRHPYLAGRDYRVSGTLDTCDKVMNDAFWIGLWPGLTEANLDFMCDKLREFFA